MSIYYHKAMLEDLKKYVTSWQQESLVFSYNLNFSLEPTGPALILKQKETGFSFSMDLQQDDAFLRISRFSLSEDLLLEAICQPVYDATLIELLLQSLMLLVYCAQSLKKEGIIFMLPVEEAAQLTALDELFSSPTSYKTAEGKYQMFSLDIWDEEVETFYEAVAVIKQDIQQQLWTAQRSSAFLRKYLQSPAHLKASFLRNILDAERKEPLQIEMGKIVAFTSIGVKR
jgi:hypothetical protein